MEIRGGKTSVPCRFACSPSTYCFASLNLVTILEMSECINVRFL